MPRFEAPVPTPVRWLKFVVFRCAVELPPTGQILVGLPTAIEKHSFCSTSPSKWHSARIFTKQLCGCFTSAFRPSFPKFHFSLFSFLFFFLGGGEGEAEDCSFNLRWPFAISLMPMRGARFLAALLLVCALRRFV